MLSTVADWFTIFGFLAAAITIVAATKQLRQASRFEASRMRPYVTVRYAYDELLDGRRCVVLLFENHGLTPATNVRLEFPEGVVWNHIGKSSVLPFQRSTGITTLYPKQRIKYLVAVSAKENPLGHLKESNFEAKIHFRSMKKDFNEGVLLSLEDYAYSLRNNQ